MNGARYKVKLLTNQQMIELIKIDYNMAQTNIKVTSWQ